MLTDGRQQHVVEEERHEYYEENELARGATPGEDVGKTAVEVGEVRAQHDVGRGVMRPF